MGVCEAQAKQLAQEVANTLHAYAKLETEIDEPEELAELTRGGLAGKTVHVFSLNHMCMC